MSENKKDDILVTLVKKAVGLPTQKSSCCGASTMAASQSDQSQVVSQGEKTAAPVENAASSSCGTSPQAESESCCGTAAQIENESTDVAASGGCCG